MARRILTPNSSTTPNITRLSAGTAPASKRRPKVKVVSPKPQVSRSKAVSSPLPPPPQFDAIEPPTLTVPAKRIENDKRAARMERVLNRRPPSPALSALFYVLRMGVLGVGIAAIAGTILTVFNPVKFYKENIGALPIKLAGTPAPVPQTQSQTAPTAIFAAATIPHATRELPDLKAKLDKITAKYPKLAAQAYFIDLDQGNFVNYKGNIPIPAASTIKIPIIVAFFQAVDQGKLYLDEKLAITPDVLASGSGDLQYKNDGKPLTALETAYKMITISDNTATNMLIKRLGGKAVLNAKFKQWGLNATVIRNPLPDLEGTNTTSPKDLATVLDRVNRGELISLKSRDRMLGIMQQTETRTLLPQGIEQDAIIAHKTGDIGTVLGDAGIIDMPNGKRIIAVIMAKRPHNDPQGRNLIQELTRTAYQHFKWYQPRPAAPKPTVQSTVKPTAAKPTASKPTAKPTVAPESTDTKPAQGAIATPTPTPTPTPTATPKVNPALSPASRAVSSPAVSPNARPLHQD